MLNNMKLMDEDVLARILARIGNREALDLSSDMKDALFGDVAWRTSQRCLFRLHNLGKIVYTPGNGMSRGFIRRPGSPVVTPDNPSVVTPDNRTSSSPPTSVNDRSVVTPDNRSADADTMYVSSPENDDIFDSVVTPDNHAPAPAYEGSGARYISDSTPSQGNDICTGENGIIRDHPGRKGWYIATGMRPEDIPESLRPLIYAEDWGVLGFEFDHPFATPYADYAAAYEAIVDSDEPLPFRNESGDVTYMYRYRWPVVDDGRVPKQWEYFSRPVHISGKMFLGLYAEYAIVEDTHRKPGWNFYLVALSEPR